MEKADNIQQIGLKRIRSFFSADYLHSVLYVFQT